MAINHELQARSNYQCELCNSNDGNLHSHTVPHKPNESLNEQVVLCSSCFDRIRAEDYSDTNYWRFLTGSIWSEVPSVQALSYKLLGKLSSEDWAAEATDAAYLDESLIAWAKAEEEFEAAKIIHKDCYGVPLQAGDTVILTENLDVKGTSFSTPKGTIVRKIRLVPDNDEQIEGKINGETIVILTKYVRKSA